jgi:hypothetical protein
MSRSDLVLHLSNEIKAVLSCRPKNQCVGDKFMPAFLERDHSVDLRRERVGSGGHDRQVRSSMRGYQLLPLLANKLIY